VSLRVWLSVFWLAGVASAATTVPKGKRTPRRPATHVVTRTVDLDAQGAALRLAPGVAVIVAGARADAPLGGRVVATLAGGTEITGRVDGAALGERLTRTVALRAADGRTSIGTGLEGALVSVAGKAADGEVVCETTGLVRARVLVPADALGAEPHELVYPMVAERVVWVAAETELLGEPGGRPRARLARGARLAVLADDDPKWTRVRTYGAFALDGVVAHDRLATGPDGAPPLDEAVPKGLTPTHEVLAGAAASADPAGRKVVGNLRGGTLVSVGVEVAGPRVKVMTYGDVVGELWVPSAALRPLEREIWNERD